MTFDKRQISFGVHKDMTFKGWVDPENYTITAYYKFRTLKAKMTKAAIADEVCLRAVVNALVAGHKHRIDCQ